MTEHTAPELWAGLGWAEREDLILTISSGRGCRQKGTSGRQSFLFGDLR